MKDTTLVNIIYAFGSFVLAIAVGMHNAAPEQTLSWESVLFTIGICSLVYAIGRAIGFMDN